MTVELLAPAGNMESFRVAVSAGADAVYLGAGDFNARRNAGNFSLDELGLACREAHLARTRVYLALNTLVLDDEMASACSLARQAADVGVDAFIVQDLGLLSALHEQLPDVELHISTQLNAIDCGAARLAQSLGASRITLGRELSLTEVERIAQEGLDVEVFCHGALCVCYSGQCLMSSLIGSRSANRGLCAQPCRLPYALELCGGASGRQAASPGRYLLSPKDLCAIDILPQLVLAGVASLKIEGRMKSPEYVGCVTSVYRSALDRALCDPASYKATSRERRLLSEAFSRGFTGGYLEGVKGGELMSYQRSNNRGVPVGRVEKVEGSVAHVALSLDVLRGDVLDVWTRRGHVTCELKELACDGKVCDKAAAGRSIELRCEGVGQADRVFRVRSRELEDMFAKPQHSPNRPGQRLCFKVRACIGQPLQISVRDDAGCEASVEGDVCEAALTKAITADEIREHVGRLGGTPYVVEDCDVELDENVGMGFSAIHKLRSRCISALQENVLASFGRRRTGGLQEASGGSANAESVESADSADSADSPRHSQDLETHQHAASVDARPDAAVISADPSLVRHALSQGIAVYAPPELCAELEDLSNVVCMLPTVIHEAQYDELIELGRRCKGVVADSVWALARFSGEGIFTEAGPRCNALNASAARALRNVGAQRLWLSPELTLEQARSLARACGIDTALVVSGRAELMITEQCQLAALGKCSRQCATCSRRACKYVLRDRKDYAFPIRTDICGRGHIYNSAPLDAVPYIGALLESVSRFVVDATLMTRHETESQLARLVCAMDQDCPPPAKLAGSTTGHLFRPLR